MILRPEMHPQMPQIARTAGCCPVCRLYRAICPLPVHRDMIAAEQRAAENALAVVHPSHAFSIPGQGAYTHSFTHTVLDLGERDLGGFCYCCRDSRR